MNKLSFLLFFVLGVTHLHASNLYDFKVVDKDYLMLHFKDGDVEFLDDASGNTAYGGHSHEPYLNTVTNYGDPLDIQAATDITSFLLTSEDDENYGTSGENPVQVFRKSKLNGHAEMEWNTAEDDYFYEHTMEHTIYLELPYSLSEDKTYVLQINEVTNSDNLTQTFDFNIFQNKTEAIRINLAGYSTSPTVKSADLYIWMGDGGHRDYSDFEGNTVYLYNVEEETSTEAGTVEFWQESQGEAQGYNYTRSPVWNVDFTGFDQPGTYRLAVEGVGCSEEFEIKNEVYYLPFKISTLGFFYMRIGQDSTGMEPVPRRPLWIPGEDPSNCKVLITDMHPYQTGWSGDGDRWDQPDFFANHVLPGQPENPHAYGGHSDALDWDRHLGHVSIIWDMLLPYILTQGALSNDDLGIYESGNGIPDIIDEARNEVDFFLRLRHGKGYSHGLTNPKNNILYQAGNTHIAAWANAMNSAMLAESFRISGHENLMQVYTDSAKVAFHYADQLDNPGLDYTHSIGEGIIKGRDMKMTAAAFLYNLTGDKQYEDVIEDISAINSDQSAIFVYNSENINASFNQLYAIAAYLTTPQTVNYPDLYENMKNSVIHDALEKEVFYTTQRPSRRANDNTMGYFPTVQNAHRSIVAHAVVSDPQIKEQLENALILEADWSLGRNPLNMIQMTTATTELASKRSVENIYTSGRNDGTPGLHPGHTPYLNMDGWFCGMLMGCPPRLHDHSYPENMDLWPKGELYFNTRFVWAHSEFTPQQTMRGKMALYGYLYGISADGITEPETGDASDPFHPYYNFSGRTDQDRDGGPVMYYAGSFMKVRFEGTSVQATLKDIDSFNSQRIGFMINGETMVYKTLDQNTTQTFEVASGLPDQVHELVMFKMRDPGDNSFGLQFQGLSLDPGKGILPADSIYNLNLVFYGDSFTAGAEAGSEGENDGWKSFANVCARILNADIHNNGIGGLAVMDNTGWYQDQTVGFETTFDKLDPGPVNDGGYKTYHFDQLTPDIIIFGFGINDDYGAGDPFAEPEVWKETYKTIIKEIADKYDNNDLRIIIHPANIYNQAFEYGLEVVKELREEGYDAYWFTFSFLLEEHPSTAEAQQMGEELAAFIQNQVIAAIPLRSVSLSHSSITLKTEDSFQLEASLIPANATGNPKLTWSSEDESIATVDQNGLVQATSLGSTIIKITSENGGFSDECAVTVSNETNVNDFTNPPFSVYPNPVTGNEFILKSENWNSDERLTVKIFSMKGDLLDSYEKYPRNGSVKLRVDLQKGTYLIEINTKKGRFVKKIVMN